MDDHEAWTTVDAELDNTLTAIKTAVESHLPKE